MLAQPRVQNRERKLAALKNKGPRRDAAGAFCFVRSDEGMKPESVWSSAAATAQTESLADFITSSLHHLPFYATLPNAERTAQHAE